MLNLDWLYTAISWVLKLWHSLFSTFLDPAGGLTWALSIAFLVITVRVLLFRLFVKQVRSQRAMQELQPDIAKLKKQYGSDRQGMAVAMQALQKERGVNPLASCLPILPQIPVFISLLHVLRRLRPGADGLYGWSNELTDQAARAKIFGAPISSQFTMSGQKATDILMLDGVTWTSIRVVTSVLIVVMCLTTFFTQKQIMRRSGPVEGQAAMIQKLMLYGMPLGLFASSFFFPLGVLLYWFINNLWTLGQQFYILRALPPPGSPGALAKAELDRPKVDPKTLAPKPGAKPVRQRGTRSNVVLNGEVVDSSGAPIEADASVEDGTSADVAVEQNGSGPGGSGTPGGSGSANGSGSAKGSGSANGSGSAKAGGGSGATPKKATSGRPGARAAGGKTGPGTGPKPGGKSAAGQSGAKNRKKKR